MKLTSALALLGICVSASVASGGTQCIVTEPYWFLNGERQTGSTNPTVSPYGTRTLSQAFPSFAVAAVPPRGYALDGWILWNGASWTGSTLDSIDESRIARRYEDDPATVEWDAEKSPSWSSTLFLSPCFSWLSYRIAYNAADSSVMVGDSAPVGPFIYTNSVALATAADFGWRKDGWRLAGWSLASNGVAVASPGALATGETLGATGGVVRLFAVWEEVPRLQVAFRYRGADGRWTAETNFVERGESAAPPDAAALSPRGFSFTRWNGSYSNVTAATTVFAVYSAHRYTVRFDPNGGDGEMSDAACTCGEPFEIPACRFSLAGSRFVGWSPASGGAVAYLPGDMVADLSAQDGAEVALYACWEPLSCMLEFDPNGGEGEVAPVSIGYGEEFAFPDCGFVRGSPGEYSFGGWASDPDGPTDYDAFEVVTNLTDVTSVRYYAKWRYEFGGLSEAADANVELDSYCNLSFNDESTPWSVDDAVSCTGGASAKSGVGDSIMTNVVSGAGTLRFRWRADESSKWLSFRCKTLPSSALFFDEVTNAPPVGEWGEVEFKVTNDVTTSFCWQRMHVDGFTGSMWVDDVRWIPDGFGVVFHPNGGTGAMNPMEGLGRAGFAGEKLPECGFTNGARAFLGWSLASGGEVVYEDEDEFDAPSEGDLHLYAVWDPLEVDAPAAAEGLVYDGSTQLGVASGAGYSVVSNAAVAAGAYVAVATLERGYAWSDGGTDPREIAWSIAKAEYDMGCVAFEDKSFDEDGKAKSIFVAGELPAGVAVAYAGNGVASAGAHQVVAMFTGDAANFKAIPDMSATLTIVGTEEPDPDPQPAPEPDPDPDPDDADPVLFPTPAIGEFTGGAAATYNGWLLDQASGRIAGTVQVKTTKVSKGVSKSTIAYTLLGEKKRTEKTTVVPGWNATDAANSGIVYGDLGLVGTFRGYALEASKDFSKSKVAAEKALVDEMPQVDRRLVFRASAGGNAVLSVSVAKKGKAKVSGTLANGKKITASVQGVLGEGGIFAVPVVYSKSGAELAFILWIDGDKTAVSGLSAGWTLAAASGAEGLADGEYALAFELPGARNYLRTVDGVDVVSATFKVSGSKYTVPKTVGKLSIPRGATAPTVVLKAGQSASNLASFKLKYTAKTGVVSGSFKLHYVEGGKLKKDSATVSGVVVGGGLFATATVKKVGTFAVEAVRQR